MPHQVGGHVRGHHDVALTPLLDACVVDQYVKSTGGLDGLGRSRDGRVVGGVELDQPCAQLLGGPAPAFTVLLGMPRS